MVCINHAGDCIHIEVVGRPSRPTYYAIHSKGRTKLQNCKQRRQKNKAAEAFLPFHALPSQAIPLIILGRSSRNGRTSLPLCQQQNLYQEMWASAAEEIGYCFKVHEITKIKKSHFQFILTICASK